MKPRTRVRSALLALTLAATLLEASPAHPSEPDDETQDENPNDNPSESPARLTLRAGDASFALSGYIEAFYTYDGNRPASRAVSLRDFDARSEEFALSNAALVLDTTWGGAYGRAALQYGLTPRVYYSAEPRFSALQELYAGYKASFGLSVDAGLFLSPLGLEGLAVKDEWNWSRSNVWTALPTYHLGARATYPLSIGQVRFAVYNGWNQIIDTNLEKTIALEWQRALASAVTLTAMYVGGVERETGAPEGRAWRHLFDLAARARVSERVEAIAYTDFGVEPNAFGVQGWASYALYARARLFQWLYAAARGDAFFEKIPPGARPIFWPTPTRKIGSITLTLDARPSDTVSLRFEVRHDEADVPVLSGENGRTTLTVGATTWF